MSPQNFSPQNATLLLIDHQVGMMGWVRSVPFETMKRRLSVVAAVLLSLPLLLRGADQPGSGANAVAVKEAAAPRPMKSLIPPGESFLVGGRPSFILWPEAAKRAKPQPWIFYAPTLPDYPDTAEKWMHEQFLAAGVAVAGIDVGETYGSPAGREHFSALYRELTGSRGFAALCPLVFIRGFNFMDAANVKAGSEWPSATSRTRCYGNKLTKDFPVPLLPTTYEQVSVLDSQSRQSRAGRCAPEPLLFRPAQ